MELPLFPLNVVLFPGATLPLHIFEQRYKQMIGQCIERKQPFGVLLIRSGTEAGGPAAEPYEMGTMAHIQQVERLEDGKMNIICTGGSRFRVLEIVSREPYLVGRIETVLPAHERDRETDDLAAEAAALFGEYLRLYLTMTNQWSRTADLPADPDALADFIGSRLPVPAAVKQSLLEELSAKRRLTAEKELLGEAIRQLAEQVKAARTMRWEGFGVKN